MRYANWDVLLFPHCSKTPIQEFRTQCFVVRDNDAPPNQNTSFPDVRYVSDGRPLTQVPVLTTFVPSLVHNAPFRVSIHSWEQPKPSRLLESLVRPGDSVVIEARIYIDGVLAASSVFNRRTMWPHVMDLCSGTLKTVLTKPSPEKLTEAEIDKEGYQESLGFPPFHQEILQASNWDAGQLLGRIRIIMTEGFTRESHSPPDPPKHTFIRVRDSVAFSFQHAPLHILEFSGIAWPNPGMWTQAHSRTMPGPAKGHHSSFVPTMEQDDEAHAHSPSRPKHSHTCGSAGLHSGADYECEQCRAAPDTQFYQSPNDNAAWRQAYQTELGVIRQNESLADPFLEPRGLKTEGRRKTLKKSSEDTPMPDVPNCEPSRSISGMTNVSYEHREGPCNNLATHEAIMNQLVQALSPLKGGGNGPPNPINTPSGKRDFTGVVVPQHSRSAPRRVSRAKSASPRTVEKRGGRQDRIREASIQIISASPGLEIQSRKEGDSEKESTADIRVAAADFGHQSVFGGGGGSGSGTRGYSSAGNKRIRQTAAVSSDSKRKRPLDELRAAVDHGFASDSDDNSDPTGSSPSKKVSKMASTKVLITVPSPHTPGRGKMASGVSVKLTEGNIDGEREENDVD